MQINTKRRAFLGVIGAGLAGALLLPLRALAAIWNKPAFDAEKLDEAENKLDINGEIASKDIVIVVPDRAENGAIVQVEITANIANAEAIAIFVEKNPTPLIANIMLSQNKENNIGAQAKLVTRIKMAETSDIKVVVSAGGKYYTASKQVQVVENGCGGGGSADEKFESSIKLRAKLKNNLTEIKAIIIHPMHTGRAKDDFEKIIPAHFIQLLDLQVNGKPAFQMQWGTGIAKNPYLTCYVDNAKLGDKVTLTWHDNLGKTGSGEIVVTA
jgi:sulfur-oxidizing protein SoxY